MNFRIGQGFDVHQLAEGHALTLGGIVIPHDKGLKGHSDADVLIHAICDALLGAANLGDIGYHFPPSDDAYKSIDSKELLKKVGSFLNEDGFSIGNIDSTVCLQKPKIGPFLPDIKTAIASTLGVAESQVSVKATTTENLGFEGREEGISAHAIALLQN